MWSHEAKWTTMMIKGINALCKCGVMSVMWALICICCIHFRALSRLRWEASKYFEILTQESISFHSCWKLDWPPPPQKKSLWPIHLQCDLLDQLGVYEDTSSVKSTLKKLTSRLHIMSRCLFLLLFDEKHVGPDCVFGGYMWMLGINYDQHQGGIDHKTWIWLSKLSYQSTVNIKINIR